MTPDTPLSIYLHIPFCRHRCAYCDFNTYAGQEENLSAYVDALCNEIQALTESDAEKRQAHTVFFGGGTPSLLSPFHFEKILSKIQIVFDLVDPEITIEANPGTVSLAYLRELHTLGINRISFGVQSANPGELRMLERAHSYFDVINAVTWARQAGFYNLSLDLIYGLPHQTLDSWSATVKLAAELCPEHFSLYALTMEHGTPFGRWSARGLISTPDPDAAAEMYEWADGFLAEQGYQQYEISNWAKDDCESSDVDRLPSRACAHNLQYWRNRDYLGLGAGAHGFAVGVRYSNVLRIKTYIDRLTHPASHIPQRQFPLTPAAVHAHKNTLRETMQETLMTGLRLTREGVSDADFRARFGVGIEEAFPDEVNELLTLNLLEWKELPSPRGRGERDGKHRSLRLTPRARLLGNQVFIRFVGG
ncbi:MAG: radical SAM family heme chaperone HemW [Anaerolineales bacterium]